MVGTNARKALVRDAIAGIRAAGAKFSMVGNTVVVRATPEQKQCIEPYADILQNGKRDEIESCLVEADQPTDPIEACQSIPKPANFIPRDGLLARCVRMLATEGYSQTRIARELRLNRRTVASLLQPEVRP